MDLFDINYVEVEDTLTVWKGKSMIKSEVFGSIAPFQMFTFLTEYVLTDSSDWADLDYKQAK